MSSFLFTIDLKAQTHAFLDASMGGNMKTKIVAKIKDLIDNITLN